jgi:hypothetical protein
VISLLLRAWRSVPAGVAAFVREDFPSDDRHASGHDGDGVIGPFIIAGGPTAPLTDVSGRRIITS